MQSSMLESINGSCTKVDKVLSDPSTPSPSLPRISCSSPDASREFQPIQGVVGYESDCNDSATCPNQSGKDEAQVIAIVPKAGNKFKSLHSINQAEPLQQGLSSGFSGSSTSRPLPLTLEQDKKASLPKPILMEAIPHFTHRQNMC